MESSNSPTDLPQSTALTPYAASGGLIRRGLDDLERSLLTQAKVWRVPFDFPTLQQAVDTANQGDVVEIFSGVMEGNTVINKGLTILGIGKPCRLISSDAGLPVLDIALLDGIVEIENLHFEGKEGSFWKPQVGIRISSGEASIKHCQFTRWCSSDDSSGVDGEYWKSFWSSYEPSSAVSILGNGAVARIFDSTFHNLEIGAEIVDKGKLTIENCVVEASSVFVCAGEGHVASYSNSVDGRGFLLGHASQVYSQYDSIINGPPVSASHSAQAVAAFSHVTIRSSTLISIALGKSFVHPASDGTWIWNAPRISFKDSIILVGSDEPEIARVSDARHWSMPQLRVLEYLQLDLIGNSLIRVPPSRWCPDPDFGDLVSGQLTLRSSSPAIGAASDGTNIGAWQGTPV